MTWRDHTKLEDLPNGSKEWTARNIEYVEGLESTVQRAQKMCIGEAVCCPVQPPVESRGHLGLLWNRGHLGATEIFHHDDEKLYGKKATLGHLSF